MTRPPSHPAVALAALLLGLSPVQGHAETSPLFALGDEGRFGNFEQRGFYAPVLGGTKSDRDAVAFGFTAMERTTFDQVTMRVSLQTSIDDDEKLTVEVVADSLGQPTDDVLASTTLSSTDAKAQIVTATFDKPVTLSAGDTVHIVTRGDDSGDSSDGYVLQVFASPAAENQTRPFDKRIDASAGVSRLLETGWQSLDLDPCFALSLSAGDGQLVDGPNWDIIGGGAAIMPPTGQGQGQAFVIYPAEVPAGAGVLADRVAVNIRGYTAEADLIVGLRELTDLEGDRSLPMVEGTLSKADFAEPGFTEVVLDRPVLLVPGKTYLLTTAFATAPASGSVQFVTTNNMITPAGVSHGYGGAACCLVGSGGGQNWDNLSPLTDRDLQFMILGEVVAGGRQPR